MARDNSDSTILFEHRKIVTARHILALINFIAILIGTIVTRHFVLIRGSSDGVLIHINIMLAINIVQIGLCLADYITKNFFGLYLKPLVYGSYGAGAFWFLLVVGELVAGTVELGNLRLDLTIIAALQLVTAIVAYIVWPALDYSAIQKLTSKSIREDEEKRAKKARGFVVKYVIICVFMVAIQAGMFFAYKVPPTVYDIFSDTRALQYTPSEDGEGYVVSGVYMGTSSHVNVPATYNNKPVVGISAGALSDITFIEKYKISDITIGTPATDENGNEIIKSNIKFIEAGAIVNDKIETLKLPSSILNIGVGAIKSTSLKSVLYEAQADFSIAYLDCSALSTVSMDGDSVGNIVSLDGMSKDVTIKVAKAIYNEYRKNNPEYVHSFRPILSETEFCVDFYTDCTYYIDSIFSPIGTPVTITYKDLINKTEAGISLVTDTESYIKNKNELGTNGAKADSAFRGWYSDRAMTQEHEFTLDGALTFSTDTALYAKWIDEYTGKLDWGTYQPDGVDTTMYWTNEDVISLPVFTTREGYANGVQWYTEGIDAQIINTSSISENKTFKATWLLDKPTDVDIDPNKIGDWIAQISQDKNDVQFTYDELNILALSAKYKHVLDDQGNQYSIKWTKVGDDSFSNAQSSINVQNVLDSGEYVMTVTVKSKWGETSSDSTSIRVNVSKKALNIGTAKLDKLENGDAVYKNLYNGKNHTLEVDESLIVDKNVEVIYTYFDENDKQINVDTGVKNAGKYKVKAFFQKNNALEQSNYETKELQAGFEILPKPLTFESWTADALVYTGANQTVTMKTNGTVAGDDCNILYKEGSNVQKNAGDYRAEAIGVDNPNYTLNGIDDDCTHEWSITKKVITVLDWKIDGTNTYVSPITYNGSTHTVIATADGTIGGDKVNFLYSFMPDGVTPEGLEGKVVGKYTASITGVDNPNYTFDATASNATLVWEIKKAPVTVVFDAPETLIYDGTSQGIIATIQGIASVDFEQMKAENFICKGTAADIKQIEGTNKLFFSSVNAETYTAEVSEIKNGTYLFDNYELTASSASFTIDKKTLTFTHTSQKVTYNGAEQDLKITVNGIASTDLEGVKLEQFTVDGITAIENSNGTIKLIIEGKKDAGSYGYGITAFANDNYTLTPVTAGSYTINKKTLNIKNWQILDESTNDATSFNQSTSVTYNYDGYTVTPVVDGIFDNFELSLTENFIKDASYLAYTVTASLPSAQTSNYVLPNTSVSVTVLPYEINFGWEYNKTGTGTFVYDGTTTTVTPTYEVLGNDVISLTYSSSQSSAKNVGEYNVTISDVGNSNYSIGTGASKTWKITPKTVTVTWNVDSSYIYNGDYQAPTFSVDGIVDSDSYVGLSIDGVMYYFTKASTYAIADKNATKYADTYNLSVANIYKQGSMSGSYVADSNYTVLSNTAERSFTIDRRPISLSGIWSYKKDSDYSTGIYSGALPYNSYTYTLTTTIADGVITGDIVDLIYSGNTATDVKASGSYTAQVVGVDNDNYKLESENNTLSWNIAPKKLNFTWIDTPLTYTGGTQYHEASCETGATGETDGKLYSGDYTTIYYENNYAIGAGSYDAEIVGLSNSNYTLGTGTTDTWTISRKSITPIWSYTTTVYNGLAQYPTASYSGEGNYVTFTYEGTNNSDVGRYTVEATLSDTYADNYVIGTGAQCTFDILQKEIYVKWGSTSFTYDGSSHILTATPNDIVSGDNVSFILSSTVKQTNAGTYTYSIKEISGADAKNYKLSAYTSSSMNMVINPKPLSVKWDSSAFTYTGAPQTFKATLEGVVIGDSVTINYGTNGNSFTNAGVYTVTVEGISGTDADNYSISSFSRNFTIEKKALTVKWTGTTSVTYDKNEHKLTPSITSGLVAADADYVDVSASNSAINAGSHTIYAELSGTKASNYVITSGDTAQLVINKKTVTISWSTKFFTYDGQIKSLDATVKGVGGEPVSFSYGNAGNTLRNAGDLTVTVASINDSNYTLPSSGTSATLTIGKKSISGNWYLDGVAFSGTEAKITYDGNAHTFELVPGAGIVSGDSVYVTYEGGVNSYTNASETGGYTIKATGLAGSSAGNYSFTPSTVKLIINKAVATVEWTIPTSLKADGSSKTVTVTVTGANGEILDSTFTIKCGSFTVSEVKAAGKYKLTLTNTSYLNYTVANDSIEFTVTQ